MTTARGWKNGWYVVPMEATFRDIDFFGHVNNAVYFSYFEWARTQLWFELTGQRAPGDISFIVARAECDFRQPIVMEPFEVRVRIDEMRATSMDFVYEIRKDDGRQLAASGRTVVVLYDWDKRSKTPIPEELRGKVKAFQR